MLVLTFLLFSLFSIQAQTYCEDIAGRNCDDCPTIPVSPNPDMLVNCEDSIDIILIIDESNSIDSQTLENNVRDGVLAFLGELECKPVRVALIEFGSVANYVVPTYRAVGTSLTTDITNYFNDNVGFNGNTYTPDNFSNNNLGGTNWQAALLRANALPTADLLLMFTDGKPTAYSPNANNPGSSYDFCDSGSDTEEAEIYNAAIVANLLKAKDTHMFVLGIGNASSTYIPSITGTNEYNPSDGDLISNSDYEIDPNFANLAACFRNIANNLCSIIVESVGSTVCQGETNGVIDITLTTLAIGPFTVTVTNGPTSVSPFSTSQTNFSVSNLAAGTYKVKVESNDGCYEEGSVFVTIGVDTPDATCNNLADVLLETCTATIPTNFDAGDTDGELADVFSDVLTCGTAGIRHEDSNPGDICNGTTITRTYYLTDDTVDVQGVTCTRDFVFTAPALALSAAPADVTTSACVNPADEFAAWILALENMSATGGCNAEVEYSEDLNTLSVSGFCNTTAQVITVNINAKDDCGETTPVTATFTVSAYSNDLTLVGTCPTANEVDGCSTNLEISAAFDTWKSAVLANFSATGGCNAEVEYSTDVSALQAPTQCGSTDQIISVDINAKDDCGETSITTCSFTVKAFASTLLVTEVTDESYNSCDYTSQSGLDAAFQAFLDKFGYTGGCDASGQLASAYSAPDLCSGGTVSVTYNVTDLCESDNETASFTITPSEALEVSCATAVSLSSSSTQQEIEDAYDAWKLEFTKTGGCEATDNLDTFPSLPSFDCGTAVDLSFTYTAIDRCHPNGVSCSSTFFVPGIVGLTVTCPDPVNLPACSSDADILEAYNAWKAGFVVNGGDNPTSNIALLEAFDTTQLLNCYGGTSLGFNFYAYDACHPNGVNCRSDFIIDSSEILGLSRKPADVTTSACVNPADEFAAWILALENMTVSGGCNAEVEYSVDLATLSVSGYCNTTAQVVSVDINAKDDCGETNPVTATFTVPAYSNDLALIGDCPTENGVDGCSTNAEISAAFDTWKAAVLANFSATGGCNAEVEYSTDVSALQAPTQCGTADQIISVDINAKDECGQTSVTTCSFTVKAFDSTLEVTDVSDESYDSCDYTSQSGVDSAFQAFLDKFGYTGGCDASGQLASAYSAPDLCVGGTVNVTYNVTDLCESDNETASFTITPSEALEVSCATAVSLSSSSTQQEIEDAYDAWKLEFTKTGGCEATDNLDTFPSLPSFDCGTAVDLSFTYTAIDRCHPNGVSCSSTFFVPGIVGLTVTCPDPVNLPACSSDADILEAYNAWKAGFVVNGGDNPTSNIALLEAFDTTQLLNCYGGTSLGFNFYAYDACHPNGVNCRSDFIIDSSEILGLSRKPADVTTSACVNPADEFAAWILALENMTVSGGCNAEVEYSVDLATLSVSGYCNTTAQVVSVDINAKDDCGETNPVTATFTVPAYSNDLALIGDCPTENGVDGCSTNAEISAAFDTWKAAVLANFSATGGCNAEVEYSTDVSALQAPTQCGTADQIISVDINAKDECGQTSVTTCSFTVKAFDSTLEVTDVSDESYDSCDYTSQSGVDSAFQAFLDKFGYTGGCDASGQLASAYSAPDLCVGGTVNVTYNVTDLCESDNETASFTITPSAALEVSCPSAVSLDSSSTEQEISDAYEAWKLEFTKTGGCEATDNLGTFPSLPDFNCGTAVDLNFTYRATDRCHPNGVTCSSTFYVPGVTGLTVNCPTDVNLDSCTSSADILTAYNLWIAGFGVNNGDSPTSNIGDIPALPAYECGTAIDLSFTLSATDTCNPNGVSCTSTFKVEAAADLTLVGTCPTVNEVDGCSTNAEISSAFEIWKAAVLANFSATGGCNAEVEYSTDVSALQAPTQCGTTDQVISVDVNASDDCAKTTAITCSFTVKAFESTLELAEVADESYASCDYADQTGVDAAFQTFLDKFGYTGGCDASGQLASVYSAPDLCAGGTVSVTYDVTDLCENGSDTASFTITPSEVLEVSCPTAVNLDASSTQQEIEAAYAAWKLGFSMTGGCEATDNLGSFPSLPSYVCDTSIDLSFDYVATDRCHPNGVSCSSTFNVEGRESVNAGGNGALTICENGTVTAQELFEALGGDPDEGGTWSPEPNGANIYTYTVQGTDPCPDAMATITVEELNLEISASEPICDEEIGTYTVNVQVSEGTVSSTLGIPVDNGGGSWTIINIPTDNNIVVTTTSTVSNDVECTSYIEVISPDCICIELEVDYTDVSCFGLDDGTITISYVTEGAIVTVNGDLYDADMFYEPGTYTVVAYFEGNDDDDCIISQDVTIVEPVLVDVQVSSTDATCFGADDGTITIESLSEGAFYTIKLNGIGSDLSGQDYFSPGTYVVEAKLIDNALNRNGSFDKKNETTRSQNPCVDGKLVVIGEPNELICKIGSPLSGDLVKCQESFDNTLSVAALGGTGPYTYEWTINKVGRIHGWAFDSAIDGSTISYFTGIENVRFTVEITDANGCTTMCDYQLSSTCSKSDYYNMFGRDNDFNFETFPNPTKGKLTIKTNRLTDNNAIVELYDLIGTRIFSQSFNKISDKKINIDLSGLASQVYYLKVITKDGTKIKKVILDK
ncbi:T9SS type A sorting domain-containing protein [Psychroserpens ponticola]|uniref:T9SS type A sorting domain-containing protein n=1 Tax=Psychroserpens ponticola TaxID=2932268 RepID=A0ABY7S0E7_9FLAO|nr:T9SS type A sorting domain-containing protein [Psychroserpens ponticola]WCO02406.1 T9SS type A sorting domain-containing protein [Psychroserpens ponticola]